MKSLRSLERLRRVYFQSGGYWIILIVLFSKELGKGRKSNLIRLFRIKTHGVGSCECEAESQSEDCQSSLHSWSSRVRLEWTGLPELYLYLGCLRTSSPPLLMNFASSFVAPSSIRIGPGGASPLIYFCTTKTHKTISVLYSIYPRWN
jgi:hypothetical protein